MQFLQKWVLLGAVLAEMGVVGCSFVQENGCIKLISRKLRLQIEVDVISPVEIGVNSDLCG